MSEGLRDHELVGQQPPALIKLGEIIDDLDEGDSVREALIILHEGLSVELEPGVRMAEYLYRSGGLSRGQKSQTLSRVTVRLTDDRITPFEIWTTQRVEDGQTVDHRPISSRYSDLLQQKKPDRYENAEGLLKIVRARRPGVTASEVSTNPKYL